jgi:hypothetical protein
MEKLNLTPQERRLVAGVGFIVFVFLNIWLVWPHFRDWRKISDERDKAERTLRRYQAEVAKVGQYRSRLHELEQMGERVISDDQDLNLIATVQNQAQMHKLEVYDTREVRTSSTQTNQFFDEKAIDIKFRADTGELVNFLESLTGTDSLIRVRDMNLRPEPPNAPNRLNATLVLIASYQRPTAGKSAGAGSSPASAPMTSSPKTTAAAKTSSSAAKTNLVTKKQPPDSKPGSGSPSDAVAKKSVEGSHTDTNKTAIPRPKPIIPSRPKS